VFGTDGNVYVAMPDSDTIIKVTPAGTTTVVAGVQGQIQIVPGSLPASIGLPKGITRIGTNSLAVTVNNGVLRLQLP
jgi:DNA-binding beta-propeller fold protein YncE